MRVRAGRFLRLLALLRESRAVLVLALLFLGFLALSLVIHTPGLQHLDLRITQALQRYKSGPLDGIAAGITHLGDLGTLAVLEICAAFVLYRTRHPRAALLCLATLLWVPLNVLIKEVIGRPRPGEDVVAVLLPTLGLSFPSGHAMGSTLVYGFLALMAWIHISVRGPRLFWTAAFAAVAVLISLSRVYLGAHWFSDVVGGWTAGLFFLFLLAEVYKAVGAQELAPRPPQGPAGSPPRPPAGPRRQARRKSA